MLIKVVTHARPGEGTRDYLTVRKTQLHQGYCPDRFTPKLFGMLQNQNSAATRVVEASSRGHTLQSLQPEISPVAARIFLLQLEVVYQAVYRSGECRHVERYQAM